MTNSVPHSSDFAVIDLGSTSFHMVIARKVNETLQILSKMKQHVHLASGIDSHHELTEDAMQRGIDCLALFSERLQDFPMQNVRIVATQALRTAKNAAIFLERAAKVMPYPIEIIAGQEEARLIYFAIYLTEPEPGNKLIIDIGGGSTELALGKSQYPQVIESKDMGCISITKRYFSDGKLNLAKFQFAELVAASKFENIVWQYKLKGWQTAIGTSGTIKAIYHLLLNEGYTDGFITRERLNLLIDKLHQFSSIDDVNWPGLSKERKTILPGGLVILSALFRSLDIERLTFNPNSLREGVLFEMTNRNQYHENIITRNIQNLSKQYNIDTTHAERVWMTAKHIYLQNFSKINKKANSSLKTILYYATRLHEIGLIINHNSLQKHSAYILKNSQLPGLNQEQQLFLSTLVRYHRKSIKFQEMPYFSLFGKKELILLLQILRIAVLLNNQRQNDLPIEHIKVFFNKKKLSLIIPEDYLKNNALIQLDLEKEALYWESIKGWALTINNKCK